MDRMLSNHLRSGVFDGRPQHMKANTLDIIIVSYNTSDLLAQCLVAIDLAEWPGLQTVWVVDNGSTDGSVEMVRQQFPSVVLIESGDNLGFSKANNLALQRCTGDFVLLLNPDTQVGKQSFIASAEYLNGHPDTGMVSCKLVTSDGSLDLACRRSFPTAWDGFCRASGLSFRFPRSPLFARYNLTYLDENETYPVEAVNGAYMFCTRAAVNRVGLLDPEFFMYGEDLDWCYRFRQAGYKIVYHPTTTTIHHKGQSSAPRSERMIKEMFKSNILFCRKHYFPQRGWLWQQAVLVGMNVWERVALLRNYCRKQKTARP